VSADSSTLAGGVQGGRRVPDWLILTLTCFGQFMVILDASIVNVSLPTIRAGLGFSPTGLQWVVNAYLLVFGGFLLLGGRAADLFGRRRMLISGLVVFSVASLAGGLANSPGLLVASRAVQGIGAAMLAPATLTVVTTTFTESHARARAVSTWTAAGAVGGVTGSIIGGAITAELSWRWIFFINVPIGAALVAIALYALTSGHDQGSGKLDIPGAVTATGGMALAIYGIVQTSSHAWGSAHVLMPLIAGLALLAVFVLIEARFAAQPMLPLRLLRSGAVSGGLSLLILVGGLSIAIWYFVSLYLQNVLHYGPLRAGLGLTPAAVALAVTARSVGMLLTRTQARYLVLTGCACYVAGFAWLAQAGPTSTYTASVLGPTVIIAVGIGLAFTPTTSAVTARVTKSDAGIVSGMANAARQVGGSVGLAALATAASARTQSALAGHREGQVFALAAGYDRVFYIAVGVAVAAGLISLVLPLTRKPAAGEAVPEQAISKTAKAA
jgi:EmrB/QacA subfamily drug resistance transporter